MSDWDEKAVFLSVLALPDDKREAYLATACPDDAARERIRSLLRHNVAASDEFLSGKTRTVVETRTPTQIDEFKIIHRLGEGGMGVVYLAEDTILGRRVALKVLARHMIGSGQALARFREEARSAAALKHPAIVPVFKFGRAEDDYYLVSELVDGRTLAQVIAERRGAAEHSPTASRDWHRQAAEIVATIADALDCAHRAGIVHRDVKPSNILIDRERGPRLTDFGIAKHLTEENRTRHTGVIGTVHYMSPEQAAIAGTLVDQRSDIFSLGVVLYEMLSLRLPFDGPTMQHVLQAVRFSEPPKLRSIHRQIAPDLATICHKALEKQPRDRYQTAAHVAADIRCYLRGDPILAKPPSHVQIMGRLIKRHWKLATTAMIAAALATIAWIAWYRVERQRQSRSTVSVACKSARAHLKIRPIDQKSLEPDHDIDIGLIPQAPSLPPGEYRFIAVLSAQEFSEATLLIKEPNKPLSIEMPDPTVQPSLTDMARFEGGSFVCGISDPATGRESRSVLLSPFYMDRTEVSNAAYKRFVDSTKHAPPQYWVEFGYKPELAERPVVGVSWDDANDYCRFVGKRLPTAAEWEYAMRWPDGRLLPWGTSQPAQVPEVSPESIERASAGDLSTRFTEYAKHTNDVSSFPDLCTPSGLFHGAGNVSEYTETILFGATSQVQIKGAAWMNSAAYRDSTSGSTLPLEAIDQNGVSRPSWSMKVGFRCARSAQP